MTNIWLAKLLDDTPTRQSTVASTTTDGTSTEKPVTNDGQLDSTC